MQKIYAFDSFIVSGKISVLLRLLPKRYWKYREPGLLCTPQNFAQSSKFLGKNIFGKVTSEAF